MLLLILLLSNNDDADADNCDPVNYDALFTRAGIIHGTNSLETTRYMDNEDTFLMWDTFRQVLNYPVQLLSRYAVPGNKAKVRNTLTPIPSLPAHEQYCRLTDPISVTALFYSIVLRKTEAFTAPYTLLNIFREQIFEAIYSEIYWEKSFQIVILF